MKELKLKYINEQLKEIDGDQIVSTWPTAGRCGYSVSLKEMHLGFLKDIVKDKPKTVILPELGYTQIHKIDGKFYLPESQIVIDLANDKRNEKLEKAKKKMERLCQLLDKNGWERAEIDNKIYYFKNNADITHMYSHNTVKFSDTDKAYYGDTSSVDLCIKLTDYTSSECVLSKLLRYSDYGDIFIKLKNNNIGTPEWKTVYNIKGNKYVHECDLCRDFIKNIK